MEDFKFNVGDLMRINPSCEFNGVSSPANPQKVYTENLRVTFRFWDGMCNIYVLMTEDDISVILNEGDLELVEAAPRKAPEAPSAVGCDYILFLVETESAEGFYVVARSWDDAVAAVNDSLNCDTFPERAVVNIKKLASQHFVDGERELSDAANLIIAD